MKYARKRDIFIIAAIAAAGIVLWLVLGGLFARKGNVAEIYYRASLVKTVDLSKGVSQTFSLEQLPEVVFTVYPDGSIAFVASDCPDKICIGAGRLHRAGQFAACLPNQVYIKIVSRGPENPDEPDLIIG
jgi:hypothetical protein